MRQPVYLPIPLRLTAAFLCASFLATYAAADNSSIPASQSTAETVNVSAVEFPLPSVSDKQLFDYQEQLTQEAEEQALQELYRRRAKRWQLLLVNADNPLSDDYSPDLTEIGGDMQFDQRAAKALHHMIADGQHAGHDLVICSAYRDKDYQKQLYERQVEKQRSYGKSLRKARRDAARIVAAPGTSEHATGLAVDIITQQYSAQYSSLTRGFENTDAFDWLNAHCAEYGFILRYPENKTDITGVIYEPWHFRYVGKTAAHNITEQGLCLEEYLGKAEECH